MPHVRTHRHTHHDAQVLYELVADISRYPEFIPLCTDAHTHTRTDGHVAGTLYFGLGPVQSSFTTLNCYTPVRRIDMELVDGPFSSLQGYWEFLSDQDPPLLDLPSQDHPSKGCTVSFALDFEYSNWAVRKVLEPVFSKLVQSMVDAFIERADVIQRR